MFESNIQKAQLTKNEEALKKIKEKAKENKLVKKKLSTNMFESSIQAMQNRLSEKSGIQKPTVPDSNNSTSEYTATSTQPPKTERRKLKCNPFEENIRKMREI